MKPTQNICECPSNEIASYLDGELSPERELELEFHMAGCGICAEELNDQKALLCVLGSGFAGDDEVELPENFAKIVATRAESSVSGLRGRSEQFNALLVCGALFAMLLFALGTDSTMMFAGAAAIADKIGAVIGLAVHFTYDLLLGLIVILRTLSAHVISEPAMSVLVPILFAISAVAVMRYFMPRTQAGDPQTTESE